MSLSEDYFSILTRIERFHSLFYFLCEQSQFVEDKSVNTAGVAFNGKGNPVSICINPEWWENLTDYDKEFVTCHELLHIALNHGKRCKNAHRDDANIAMDVAVNHMLVNKFQFSKEDLSLADDLCWVDTVFKKKMSTEECVEYYLSRLPKRKSGSQKPTSFDTHDGLFSDQTNECADSLMGQVGENLTNEQKEDLQNKFSKEITNDNEQRSAFGTGSWLSLGEVKEKKSKKWESIIKDWSKAQMRFYETEEDQWAHVGRRMFNIPSDFILPSTNTVESHEVDRILAYFFMDTSISCINYADRFLSACKSIPEDKFIIRAFSFDTKVQEADLENNCLYGGGGTSFDILEDFVQRDIRKLKQDYPAAVFVLTDGFGCDINPQYSERWYWLITNGGTDSFVPPKSHSFDLNNYC
jgi:predicted metal-dependent peptidase